MIQHYLKKNERQIPKVLNSINQFSKAAGLKLNIDKCEILTTWHTQFVTLR